MTDKVRVKGDNAHPYYQWVAAQGRMKLPRWNFYKHVIDADGNLVEWFASTTSPDLARSTPSKKSLRVIDRYGDSRTCHARGDSRA